MFYKTETPQGATILPNSVRDAGGVLEFYSYVLDAQIVFEAFITSYNDSFNSNWRQDPVYGRMDPIHTFQNTQRTIGLTFTVPNVIASKGKPCPVIDTMWKINNFFRFLYPKYSGNGESCNALTITQAPLVRIKFGNMIGNSNESSFGSVKTTGLLGAITSLSMTPKIEHGFSKMETAGGEAFGRTTAPATFIYPNFVDLSFGFNVIHEQSKLFSQDVFGEGWAVDGRFPYGNFAQQSLACEQAGIDALLAEVVALDPGQSPDALYAAGGADVDVPLREGAPEGGSWADQDPALSGLSPDELAEIAEMEANLFGE